MKKSSTVFLILAFCWTSVVFSQEKIMENLPTGDAQLDSDLREINETAKTNIKNFADKLGRHYGVPKETADWLMKKVGMPPGDAYMAAKVSKISGKPIEDVAKEYEDNKEKGWGVIAKNLGIKPGSKEFHELKKDDSGMVGKAKGKGKKEEKYKSKRKEKKGKKK
jgi:hypothetical protein